MQLEGASSQSHGMTTSKQLNVLYNNARSIVPKLEELQACVLFHKPDLVCIVVSWLSEDVTDNEIQLHDNQVHRFDRNRHGGRKVIIIMRISIIYLLTTTLTNHTHRFHPLATPASC